ncbi:IS3 family transposase [Lysinibacillus telephonicus]|uniref:IS3 family transposase n=1 Tax=Lysinibacillus telephonicus TaxID=1714840 RepID=UPI003B9DC7CF
MTSSKSTSGVEFELEEKGFRLINVLEIIGIPEATYHYHIQQIKKEDPDKEWKDIIQELFEKHKGRYGYLRIHSDLEKQGYVINHKKCSEL